MKLDSSSSIELRATDPESRTTIPNHRGCSGFQERSDERERERERRSALTSHTRTSVQRSAFSIDRASEGLKTPDTARKKREHLRWRLISHVDDADS